MPLPKKCLLVVKNGIYPKCNLEVRPPVNQDLDVL